MTIIVLHDRFAIKGGGERLALTLAEHAGDTLCYAWAGPEGLDPTVVESVERIDLGAGSPNALLRWLKTLQAFRYKTAFLRNYDVAVYSGHYAPLAVHNHPVGRNILYCHTPPRFCYDELGFALERQPAWRRPLFRGYAALLRRLYERSAARMDVVVANSRTVQRRIREWMGLDSVVVHPPCDTLAFRWQGQGDYYLSTARLEPLKRVDVIVRAFLHMPDKKLVVASGGSELAPLKRLAAGASNITFTGWTDDAAMQKLVGECIATIYVPKDEDFGMSPVESMAAGKPVIGVREGGVTETVVHDATGVLLESAAGVLPVEALVGAVGEMTPEKARSLRGACEDRARLFAVDRFVEQMRRLARPGG